MQLRKLNLNLTALIASNTEVFMNASVINRKEIIIKLIAVLAAIAASIALPQLFHAVGVISGTGSAVGAAFLPMHIPVIIAGMLFGPVVGAAAGIASPVVSSLISGMPVMAVLPFIVIELTAYGLVSGYVSKLKINSFIKLLVVQIVGRMARALAVVTAIYVFGNSALTLASIAEFITTGLFGIILQWLFIPLCVDRFKKNS